jgi:elongation factor Tu
MYIESTANIKGRGLVVAGKVESGKLKANTELEILTNEGILKTTVLSMEMFHKQYDEVIAGSNVGLLCRGVTSDQVRRGHCIAMPGVLKRVNAFEAEVYILNEKEGGRTTGFTSGYRPQGFYKTADITSEIHLPSNKEILLPGENSLATVHLDKGIYLEEGMRFSLRERSMTIGRGVITKILDIKK